jgi:2-polyprenyl-3-methyl-5-hydroxy-6-metoxy-1,4-benzoquinol methylase
MQRVPEPEIMDDEEQVRAYASADFDEPHSHFISLLSSRLSELPETGRALDLGCGAGDITRRFALAYSGWIVDGIDGSRRMLDAARDSVDREGVSERVNFMEILLPASPPSQVAYDLIFSNSLLHHLENPAVFWSSVVAWSASRTHIFVMDLMRPSSSEQARSIVEKYSGAEPEVLKTDFFNSLLAAFEPGEIAAQLKLASLNYLKSEVVSDRHIIVWGRIRS